MQIANIKQSPINEAIIGRGFQGGAESSTLLAEQHLTNIQDQGMKTGSALKMTSDDTCLSGC